MIKNKPTKKTPQKKTDFPPIANKTLVFVNTARYKKSFKQALNSTCKNGIFVCLSYGR